MFIPVALGLLDSTGNDMPLSSVYHDGKFQTISSNNEPVYSTVLRVTKVREELLCQARACLIYNVFMIFCGQHCCVAGCGFLWGAGCYCMIFCPTILCMRVGYISSSVLIFSLKKIYMCNLSETQENSNV